MTKHTQGHWRADGANVFAGRNCIGICDTDNSPQDAMEANARLMAAAPELLSLVKLFEETLEYYIRLDRKRKDNEGANLKGVTLHMVRAAIARATTPSDKDD